MQSYFVNLWIGSFSIPFLPLEQGEILEKGVLATKKFFIIQNSPISIDPAHLATILSSRTSNTSLALREKG